MATQIHLAPGDRAAADQFLADLSTAVDNLLAAGPADATDLIDATFELTDRVIAAATHVHPCECGDMTSIITAVAAELARRLLEAGRA